jgi:hypothetical protein
LAKAKEATGGLRARRKQGKKLVMWRNQNALLLFESSLSQFYESALLLEETSLKSIDEFQV